VSLVAGGVRFVTPRRIHRSVSTRRWICIYPAYLNNKKTLAEGRIIPKKFAVENPTYQEILEVVKASGFNAEVENKQYSRECSKEWQFRGRIRVQLKNDDGTPCNQTLSSSKPKKRNGITFSLRTPLSSFKFCLATFNWHLMFMTNFLVTFMYYITNLCFMCSNCCDDAILTSSLKSGYHR